MKILTGKIHIRLLQAVSLFLVTATGVLAATGEPISLWEFDLDKVGYATGSGKNRGRGSAFDEPLFFLDDKTIAVTYPVVNSRIGLTTMGSPGGKYVFATVLLDVGSGEVRKQGTWGNVLDAFGIAPVSDSRSVVLDRIGIGLYDKSFSRLAQIPHQPDTVATDGPPRSPQSRKLFPDVNHDYRFLKPSLSGNTVVVVHTGGFTAIVHVFDSAKLDQVSEFKQQSAFYESSDASDTAFVFRRWKSDLPARALLQMVSFRNEANPTSTADDLGGCGEPRFISEHLLLMTGYCSQLLLLNDKAQHVAAKDLDGFWAANPSPSRDGGRFVVDLFKVKASNPWLDRPPKLTDSHLVVYDTARLEPIFVLWPPPGPITYRGSYALSPDGKLLAVLHDNRIMLYQLMDQVAQHGKPAAH